MNIGFTPVKGSAHHRILVALAAHGQLTTEEIRTIAQIGGTVDKLHSGTLAFMRNEKLIEPTAIGTWAITNEGLSVRLLLGNTEIAVFKRTAASRRAEVMNREPYVPVELRRNCQRPGAYDAFDLPSLMGGQRVYRRGAQA